MTTTWMRVNRLAAANATHYLPRRIAWFGVPAAAHDSTLSALPRPSSSPPPRQTVPPPCSVAPRPYPSHRTRPRHHSLTQTCPKPSRPNSCLTEVSAPCVSSLSRGQSLSVRRQSSSPTAPHKETMTTMTRRMTQMKTTATTTTTAVRRTRSATAVAGRAAGAAGAKDRWASPRRRGAAQRPSQQPNSPSAGRQRSRGPRRQQQQPRRTTRRWTRASSTCRLAMFASLA
mmetsp:Transcript_40398/g.115153  ORF Transcript_40398/g.115153 Transcript_40398/m.115153 type:complete len:229 (+) Transcript_40398:759-1445(+)